MEEIVSRSSSSSLVKKKEEKEQLQQKSILLLSSSSSSSSSCSSISSSSSTIRKSLLQSQGSTTTTLSTKTPISNINAPQRTLSLTTTFSPIKTSQFLSPDHHHTNTISTNATLSGNTSANFFTSEDFKVQQQHDNNEIKLSTQEIIDIGFGSDSSKITATTIIATVTPNHHLYHHQQQLKHYPHYHHPIHHDIQHGQQQAATQLNLRLSSSPSEAVVETSDAAVVSIFNNNGNNSNNNIDYLLSLLPPAELSTMPVDDPIIIRGNGNMTLFGLSNSFTNSFPSSLLGRVSREEFEYTMSRINDLLRGQHTTNAKFMLLGCLCCCCSLGCSLLWPTFALSKRTRNSLQKV